MVFHHHREGAIKIHTEGTMQSLEEGAIQNHFTNYCINSIPNNKVQFLSFFFNSELHWERKWQVRNVAIVDVPSNEHAISKQPYSEIFMRPF